MPRPLRGVAAALLLAAAGLSSATAEPAPSKAPPAPEAKEDDRELAAALEALQRERAAAEAAASEFQHRCLRAFGHPGYCRCVNGRRPEAVDLDAFVLFTTRSREELGYERLTEIERELVDETRAARTECVAAMGW